MAILPINRRIAFVYTILILISTFLANIPSGTVIGSVIPPITDERADPAVFDGSNRRNDNELDNSRSETNANSQAPLVGAASSTYKRLITLDPITPAADYQIQIQLTPANFDYSKANLDGSDLRFYSPSGSPLSYWIETWNTTGTSTVWVKVPTAGTSTIIMHYGDSMASSESNGEATFLFFDDFSGTSLNTTKWTDRSDKTHSSITIANSIIDLATDTPVDDKQTVYLGFSDFWVDTTWEDGDEEDKGVTFGADNQRGDHAWTVVNNDLGWPGNATPRVVPHQQWFTSEIRWVNGSFVQFDNGSGVLTHTNATNIPTGTLQVRLLTVEMYAGPNTWWGSVIEGPSLGQAGRALRAQSWHQYNTSVVSDVRLQCDWIAVRECIFPEPSASLGFEIPSSGKIWIGDVTFSNTTVVDDTIIILAGNLTIQAGGDLTLQDVSLWMDCHAVGQYHIKVLNGGTLTIEGNSTVTAVNLSFAWFLMAKPGSNLRLLDSHFSYGGWEWGSYGNHSGLWINTNDAQVINCTIDHNYDGIYVYEASDSIVVNNTITNINSNAISLQEAVNGTVSHNTIINSSFFGISLGSVGGVPPGSHDSIVSDNTIINTVAEAISINESPNCTVSRNYIEESGGQGIHVGNSINNTINSNFIIDAGSDGIYLGQSDNSTVSDNIIANSSSHGLYLQVNSYCNITRNAISGSGSYAINIPAFATSGYCNFWGNALGANILGPSNQNNAWDTNGTNSWDNGSYGNWWDNYTGVDETPPDGFGDSPHPIQGGAGAQDNWPLMQAPDYIPPIVDHPADITYEAGTVGHKITWHPRDDHPDSYVIYQDGTTLNSSAWSGGDIIQETDGLAVDSYNITLMVNDTVGHVTSDTVWVTVIDTTPPILNIVSPSNTTYTVPTITITLSGNAVHYWYYIEGMDTTNQSWTSSEARTLENGVYTLHAYGNDSVGNEAYSQVLFTIDYPGPVVIISSPTNTTYPTAAITVTLSGTAIHYWYYIEGVDATNQTWTDSQTRTLEDGVYTLYGYGNDSIGRETRTWVVFTIAIPGPPVMISSPRNTTTYAIGAITVTLSGNATHYWYYIEGVDATNQSWTGSDPRVLGNGVYTLYAYGNDSVGRETRTWVAFTIEIDPTVIAEIYDEINGTDNLFLVSDGIAVSIDVSSPVSISIKQVSTAPETPSSLDPLGIYLDITVSDSSAFMGMWINVSFAELGNQDPANVRIYFYNETSQDWERPKLTGVDDENEVVWAWTDHLTTFGLCERIEPDEEDDLLVIIVLVVGGLTLIFGVLAVIFYGRTRKLQTQARRRRKEDWTREW